MNNTLTVLFITLSVLVLALHFLTVFIKGKASGLFGVINVIMHVALFAISSLLWQTLEATCLTLMASVFVYLAISATRVKFFREKKGGCADK